MSDSVAATCQRLLESGNIDELDRLSRFAWLESRGDPQMLMWIAVAEFSNGNIIRAREALRAAFFARADLLEQTIGLAGPDFDLLAIDAAAVNDERAGQVLRDCPIFGRAKPGFDAGSDLIVSNILSAKRLPAADNWDKPKWSLPGDLKQAKAQAAKTKVLFLVSEPQPFAADLTHNDIHFHFIGSAQQFGFDVHVMTVDTQVSQTAEFMELTPGIQNLDPDLVVLFVNFKPDMESWTQLFTQTWLGRRFKILSVICDTDECNNFPLYFWTNYCDVVTYQNDSPSTVFDTKPHKLVRWHLPFFEHAYEPRLHKDIDFSFMGSNYRGRGYYLTGLSALGVNPHIVTSNRQGAGDPTVRDFIELLRRSRMTFNTGHLAGNAAILTGRVFEAVLAETLLFEEVGSAISDFFVPFKHFIPFSNLHQLKAYIQYFSSHEDDRREIVTAAKAQYFKHMQSENFWAAIYCRL